MKEDTNIYLKCRKARKLTREEASELLDTISVDRLERIENNRMNPTPADVKIMAEKYREPNLCNYYCTHQCEIGKDYVPEVHVKDISQIVLETISAVNNIREKQYRFIDITVDGKISDEELKDFILMKHELDKIAMTVDSLQLWTEQMKSNGSIDEKVYKKIEKELGF